MALVGVVPILLFIASLARWTIGDAHRKSLGWLGRWGGLAPRALSRRLAIISAIAALLAGLFGLAVLLNETGAEVMPAVSRAVRHFGEDETAWTVEHEQDWTGFKNDFRVAWSRARLLNDIDRAQARWDEWMYAHGLRGVQASGILFLYGILVLVAGAIDVLNSGLRRRGAALALVGVLCLLFFTWVWIVSQAHLADSILRANAGLGKDAVMLPSSHTRHGR